MDADSNKQNKTTTSHATLNVQCFAFCSILFQYSIRPVISHPGELDEDEAKEIEAKFGERLLDTFMRILTDKPGVFKSSLPCTFDDHKTNEVGTSG